MSDDKVISDDKPEEEQKPVRGEDLPPITGTLHIHDPSDELRDRPKPESKE